ncbi:unnamed protein product [Mytilus coruscus]|uniref:Endonuclease/exonuclease/phosphatase domain-containing protein n=1 Tax=Mytilus coruscus TaxID=42192 RepID=A0A6J8CMV3_MYTCO|nr:unnamed protein product [Mytilus coruscus]
MCTEAGLSGFRSNHSLCATAATRLYECGVDEQIISEVHVTGHRSDAVREYKRTSETMRRDACEIIRGDVPKNQEVPTRWRGTNTPHTLDLFLTNEEQMLSNLEYQSPLGKSDHCTMKFDFNCYTNIKSKPKIIKLFSRGNYIKIKEELDKINWIDLLRKENDIDKNWRALLSIIQDMDKKYIPTKERKQIGRGKNNFQMDKNTIDKIKRKNILSKKR